MTKKQDSFKDFVLDQLRGLGAVQARAMFGGYGLYSRGNSKAEFFGIIHKGRLFFRTNDESRAAYRARGMTPFRPNPKQTIKTYYEVPVDVMENPDLLSDWARMAIQTARSEHLKGR